MFNMLPWRVLKAVKADIKGRPPGLSRICLDHHICSQSYMPITANVSCVLVNSFGMPLNDLYILIGLGILNYCQVCIVNKCVLNWRHWMDLNFNCLGSC